MNANPPVLLTSGAYLGTLAAARTYGRDGIPAIVADHKRLAPAAWSKYVSKRLRCPDQKCASFVEWLLDYGRENPGAVLYPTSDETAWLYTRHSEELRQSFRMYQPGLKAVYELLNKRHLDAIARLEGIAQPTTWFPESTEDVRRIAREACFPVVIKPVTQILHRTHRKGVLINDANELLALAPQIGHEPYAPELLAFDPSVSWPMIQEFKPCADRGIYSLSGFIDESGQVLGSRASVKVLQRPRRIGVGVCFETAIVRQNLLKAVARVCRRVGYFGVFEVEFVHSDDTDLLIDFNPRFYGQMGFDIARGLPLPTLAYHAALGDHANVRCLAAAAVDDNPGVVFCHRMELELVIGMQVFRGATGQARRWRRWHRSQGNRMIDGIVARDDWKPAVSEALRQVTDLVRHPRAFVNSLALNALMFSVDFDSLSVGS